jgi:hypothetical protein
MLLQHASGVAAERNDSEPFLSGEIESGQYEFLGNSPASKLRRNLGMCEDHLISFHTIFGIRHLLAERDLKAPFCFVVLNKMRFRFAFHRVERLTHRMSEYSSKDQIGEKLGRKFLPDPFECPSTQNGRE